MKHLTAFAIGLLFGIGLLSSGMNLPGKVLGFLDLLGRWDPSLLFVMGGAIPVAAIGFALARKRTKSLLGEPLSRPDRTEIDVRLLGGALIFGIGWGLAGVCPGPAIINLGFFTGPAIVFFAAMIAGMIAFEFLNRLRNAP
ncbi:MAG TPA: hypothetical protein PL193_15695 [Xanthobacteraceae bacterium]|nr:hypothetical protein [Xanthobacteraceae bacterium]